MVHPVGETRQEDDQGQWMWDEEYQGHGKPAIQWVTESEKNVWQRVYEVEECTGGR